jgi:hypothetical protein
MRNTATAIVAHKNDFDTNVDRVVSPMIAPKPPPVTRRGSSSEKSAGPSAVDRTSNAARRCGTRSIEPDIKIATHTTTDAITAILIAAINGLAGITAYRPLVSSPSKFDLP